MDSGEVLEFCDPRIQDIILSVEKSLGLKITHHALTLYGKRTKA
jgi:Fur family ferric uptake transcriptional regulator